MLVTELALELYLLRFLSVSDGVNLVKVRRWLYPARIRVYDLLTIYCRT
jgi:hypothetical protein